MEIIIMKHLFLIVIFILYITNEINGINLLRSPKSRKSKVVREEVVPQPDVTKVHIVFMNHLDVGYSDYGAKLQGYSANVLNTYFHSYFPAAINLANSLRNLGYVEHFKYTTHPWLLDFFLRCPENLKLANIPIQCPNSTETMNMINAIKQGDILWHDGPMNMNVENMNDFGLNVSVNISANLNKMFKINKTARVLSIRDVPGLSRAAIPTLRQNGFVGISSGVNSGSAPPALPPLSLWKAAPQFPGQTNVSEIIYMQDPLGYPNPPGPNPNNPDGMSVEHCHRAPASTEVLCFFFRNDNMGPPLSVEEVLLGYEVLRARYIKAKLIPSGFEDFFAIVWKNRHLLPVVNEEMGDTWIQGTASDPKKFARFRAMQREFQYYYELGHPITAEVVDASRFMIKPAEHTYGLPSVGDTINWKNVDFQKVRKGPNFLNEELSWVEQRQYLQLVLTILGPNHLLTKSILKAWKELEDFDTSYVDELQQTPLLSGKTNVYNFTCTNKTHSINIGFQNGAIVYLDTNGVKISPQNPLGQLVYRTYNETDTNFWLSYYRTYWNTGYGKPNSTANAKPLSQEWPFMMNTIYRDVKLPCSFLAVVSAQNKSASTYYGLPSSIMIRWDVNLFEGEISTELSWEGKPPTRLMESLFVKFMPLSVSPTAKWFYSKMGQVIDPNSVMMNGSQWQHNTDDAGVFIAASPNAEPVYRTTSWDAGITCPITPTYGPTSWPAPLKQIAAKINGMAFNIFNNVWNTNYIYWYPFAGDDTQSDSNFKARFTTKLILAPKALN